MGSDFHTKVRTAAVAGWWSTALMWALLYVTYFIYIFAMGSHPAWMMSVLGPDLDWQFIARVWVVSIVGFKSVAFMMLIASLWLTLWARGLKRSASTTILAST